MHNPIAHPITRPITRPLTLFGLLTLALCLGSCASSSRTLGDEEYKSATGGSATVKVVAADPALKQALPNHSKVLTSAAGNIDNALQVDEAPPEDVGAPLTTPEALASDPENAAASAAIEAEERDKSVDAEQAKTWFDHLLEWGGWATLGGIGLWAARLAGVPGVQLLTDPVVRRAGRKWIEPLERRAAVAESTAVDLASTVESSLVARAGLRALDQFIEEHEKGGDAPLDIPVIVNKITGGQECTIEGAFKWLARQKAERDHKGAAVASTITAIKDSMPGDLASRADDIKLLGS